MAWPVQVRHPEQNEGATKPMALQRPHFAQNDDDAKSKRDFQPRLSSISAFQFPHLGRGAGTEVR